MNYADIRPIDVANGPGVRTSIFVSGCTHHCKECFNPETWDFAYGQPFGGEQIQEILDCLSKPYIRGLSLLGGEPFEPQNQRAVLELVRAVRARFPEKDIWCYSGYTLDGELWQPSRARCEATDEMLSLLDVLVDGEFVAAQKDLSLRFRGSANQRIIDVPKSLAARQVVLWDGAMTVEPITAR